MISNFRRPAAALLLGLGAGCWGASAAADTVQMSYSVKLVGLALGTAGLQATIEPSTYQVEVNAKLSGMASAVSKSEGAAQASGGIAQGRVLPNAYATTSSNSRETRTRFLPNLCNVTLISDALGRSVRLRVAAAALRSVEHRGGLDAFLLKAREEDLSQNAKTLRREIIKKQAVAAA